MKDHLDDDANVKDMRATAQQVGLTARLLALRRGLLAQATALDRDRAQLTQALELLGEGGVE